ncbi:type II secretion system minor pseudopilin GspI [Escherichia coli]|uniref:type II secretion system minor pseudopilin GspI n=1 Tax=Escherichia coli TaxID=562 RepID=UPI0038B52E09
MKRGFTLLEVMLALAIFALAATAVLQIASGALSNQQILEEKTVAGWVAENQTALLYFSSVIQSRRAWFSAVGGQQ